MALRTVLIIGGPTASGKSGLAMAVAAAHAGCIINADSLQIYRGLPLLTAQPTEAEKEKIPHRLYETLNPNTTCNAASWRGLALSAIDAAIKDNQLPIITGGTGFYLKTLIDGISPIPDIPAHIRDELMATQRKLGNPGFHAAFAALDPVMAAKLDPMNTQRVIRAWEVLAATGKSLAEWQSLPREKPPAHLRIVTVSLLPERDTLYTQCNARFDAMMAAGALDEVAAFKERIRRGDVIRTAGLTHALGYAELTAYLERKITRDEAVEAAKQSTRHYAKRQVTWFRHQIKAERVLATPDAGAISTLIK